MVKAHWNKKVAANRGPAWRKKLLAGRLDIQMNPTKLRLSRIKLNKTQIDLAKKVGMSSTTYGAVESGRRAVAKTRAEKIAKSLGMAFTTAFAKTKNHPNRFMAAK